MESFDAEKSKLVSIEDYRLERDESGDLVLSDPLNEMRSNKARSLVCVLNAIYKHIAQSEGSPKTLNVTCID